LIAIEGNVQYLSFRGFVVGDFCVPSMVLAFEAINGKAVFVGLKRIVFGE
jgi:hypothetical protein